MATAILLLAAALAVYTACHRPPWFWTVFVGGPVLLEILGKVEHFDTFAIPAGGILFRATDAGLLGVVVGALYHGRRRNLNDLLASVKGKILGLMLVFVGVKVIYSVLLCGPQIMANRSVSHAAGGLVAALGDVRDGLLPLFAPYYAFVVRRSCNLRLLGWPIVIATLIILVKSAIFILLNGKIWTGTEDTEGRFIHAFDAISLTLFSYMLFFLHVPRLSRGWTRALAVFALLTAFVANHRSQWVGAVGGLAVLGVIVLAGRPMLRRPSLSRAYVAGGLFVVSLLVSATSFFGGMVTKSPLLDTLTVRLYAITDPARDADSEWRAEIWKDRIEQVGSNWPWGRPFGDRHESLFHGHWINLPDHSAYVGVYELGGAILSVLVACFWLSIILESCRMLIKERDPQLLWPPAVALAITVSSLAFGSAYAFPYLGPALALGMVLAAQEQRSESREPISSSARSRVNSMPISLETDVVHP